MAFVESGCISVRLQFFLQLFVAGFMSYLRFLCLFVYSGVLHILCCIFALFVFVLCTLCCQFLWIVHFRSLLLYSLTFILYPPLLNFSDLALFGISAYLFIPQLIAINYMLCGFLLSG